MKHIYILFVAALGFSFAATAQTEVTVDGSATWVGFANVFETEANGGGFVFNSGWGVDAIKSTVGVAENTMTLQPNFNTYAENPTDPFWVDQTTLEGNKVFEGNTFVEDASLVGSEIAFTGLVESNTLSSDYVAIAFIKVFNADFSVVKTETAALVDGEAFVVNYTNVEGADAIVQYGFTVTGVNANPADEAALGSILIGSNVLSVESFDPSSVSIYPNPTVDRWSVSSSSNVITGVAVYDVLGKLVLSAKPDAVNYAIDASRLNTGLYIATVTTTEGTKTVRLVKN
ncbi:MAG: hypothetical protein ACI828_002078 [Flavobacteriales bacterium]|jgi:hypothetical protein